MNDVPSRENFDCVELQHWSREEWFYMWSKGLDARRIAALCRVPYRTVYDHIRTRIVYRPDLFGQRLMLHDRPAVPLGGLPKRKATWEERAALLVAFYQNHGRFPRGYIEDEGTLYSFLQNQRRQYRAGKLIDSRESFLTQFVPGWLTPPKSERESALWDTRVNELEKFVRDHARYPHYKTAKDNSEKVLAAWMDRQRHCQRAGILDSRRELLLDQRIPGWLMGKLR